MATTQNKEIKSQLKTEIKKAKAAYKAATPEQKVEMKIKAAEVINNAIKFADQAVSKGIIAQAKADKIKSKLQSAAQKNGIDLSVKPVVEVKAAAAKPAAAKKPASAAKPAAAKAPAKKPAAKK